MVGGTRNRKVSLSSEGLRDEPDRDRVASSPKLFLSPLYKSTIYFNLLFARTAGTDAYWRTTGDLTQVIPHCS